MKCIKLFFLSIVIILGNNIYAQKYKIVSGSLASLKGVQKIQIQYDYSDLGVGKFDKEEDYVAKKMQESEEKEAGAGAKWKESWLNDRPNRYEVKFEELFTKYTEGITSGKAEESDVVMKVHTTFIEPGFNIGISSKPAYVDFTITFLKGGQSVAEVSLLQSPGSDAMGVDFDSGYRISESYAKAGKVMAQRLMKEIKE